MLRWRKKGLRRHYASAAEANKVAEQERLARLQIEHRLAPRILTSSDAAILIADVAPYSGTPVDIFIADQSKEAASLAEEISSALTSAGWLPVQWEWVGESGISGVAIGIKQSADLKSIATAESLRASLDSIGLNGQIGRWPGDWKQFSGMLNGPDFNANRTEIRIIVGEKPTQ